MTTRSVALSVGALAATAAVAVVLVVRRRARARSSSSSASPVTSPTLRKLPSVAPSAPAPAPVLAHSLTAETVKLIEASTPVVGSLEAARIFYTGLFEAEPELRTLFKDPTAQERKLVGMLKWVNATIGEPQKLHTGLRELGERHVKYNAQLSHFRSIKASFLHMVSIVDQQSLERGIVADEDEEDQSTSGRSGRRSSDASRAPSAVTPKPIDREQRLREVSRAWEALLYVFVGEMGPAMLLQEQLAGFHAALKNDLAAPAGGTCVALAGAQGAALVAMAAALTRAPRSGSRERGFIDAAVHKLEAATSALETLASGDMAAYCAVMAAVRQPPLGAAEARTEAIATALEYAARAPLQVAQWAAYALDVARCIAPLAANSGVGDLGAGASLLVAAGRTSVQNVGINTGAKLARHGGRRWHRDVQRRALEVGREIDRLEAEVNTLVSRRMRAATSG